MKNLFKNLMLVAVAAMAFTACQKDNEDVNRVNETTVVEFKAEFDTTRSGFGDKEGDKGYSSHWDGNEAIDLEVVSTNDGGVSYTSSTPKSDDVIMGEDGTFRAEFNGNIYNEGTITARIPAGSWETDNYTHEKVPSIPGTQTPEVGSVDPAAHILKAEKTFEGGMSKGYTLEFAHQVAYAKMNLNLGTVVAFAEIAQVAVEIDAQRYTLLPENLSEPTFWFACKAATPEAMTVTITDKSDNTYVKELDLAGAVKPLAFTTGRVASFTVGGFEKVVLDYVKSISATYNQWNHRYEFIIDANDGARLWSNIYVEPDANGLLPEGEYDSDSCGYSGFGYMYGDYANWQGYEDFTYYWVNIAQSDDEGYEISFWLQGNKGAELTFDYSGVVSGINNPPVPDPVTVTTAPASVNGRANNDGYDYTYYLSFVAGDWTIDNLYFYAPVSSNGIIPEGEQTIKGGTATLTDTTWAFAITEGTVTVAYSDEDYVLTFAFEDANGSTYEFSYTGVIEGDGIFQPGAVTPLATPTNVAYELVDFTKARITWDAVDGAGSYELYHEYWDNTLSQNVESAHVTTDNNYYVFEDLTAGTNYSVFVKSLPADENKNTASENYESVYNVKVFAAPNSMETTYTFNTAVNTGNNKIKFSNANGDSAVIAFPQSLENIAAGTYLGGWDADIDPYNCKVNGASIGSIDYVVVEGTPGEEQTVTMVLSLEYGEPSIKAVFTGLIDMEVAPTVFTSATVAFDGNNLSYKFYGDGNIRFELIYFGGGVNGIAAGEYNLVYGTDFSGWYTYFYDGAGYQYMKSTSTLDLTVTGAIGAEQTYTFVLHTENVGDITAVYTGVLMAQ